MSESNYGLPVPRDGEGELQAVDHEYEWGGQNVQIKIIPPTIAQIREYEKFGTDASVDDMIDVYERHIEEPSIPTDNLTSRELMCYVEGIVDYGTGGGGSDIVQQAQAELEQRETAAGN